MPSRPVTAALAASVVLATAATACGSSGGPTGPIVAPPPRVGAVEVDPRSGPVGTVFTLTARGLAEGLVVAFEITFPGEGKAFPGAALTVPADGTASTTYRATTANQPGDYVVRLTGPPGSLAEGRFTVSSGPPLVSTVPEDTSPTISGPSTTGRTGTTTRRTTTTAAAAAGLPTSTTRGVVATTITRRTSSTLSATTTTRAAGIPPR